jgi:hypothetical protein
MPYTICPTKSWNDFMGLSPVEFSEFCREGLYRADCVGAKLCPHLIIGKINIKIKYFLIYF